MATEILPHKALNNISSMHYYLKQKLISSKQVTDLIPFINVLSNIEQLKKQLLLSLDSQFEKEKAEETATNKSDTKSKIRSLFVSLFSLNGIPSDIIHAKIISFLPSKEYKKLPVLSSHFRNVMRNNPFIFNEKGYTVNLLVNTQKLSTESNTEISIQHQGCTIDVKSSDDDDKQDNVSFNENPIIAFDKVKCWEIDRTFHWGIHQDSQTISASQDSHNIKCVQLLSQNNKTIEKLIISAGSSIPDDIISNIFGLTNSFNQLYVLSLHALTPVSAIKFGENSFQNLQCLDIDMGFHDVQDWVNSLMDQVKHTLKCIRICSKEGWGGRFDEIDLKLTPKLEWIYLDGIRKCKVDLTECKHLIGVNLIGVSDTKVTWPMNDYIIPFLCVCDEEKSMNWRNKVVDKGINAKFVVLMTYKSSIESGATGGYRGYSRSNRIKAFNDDDTIKRIKMNDFNDSKENDQDICFVLDKTDIDDNLWKKVLKYSYKDENLYKLKVRQYEKYWRLNSMNWIKSMSNVTSIDNSL